MKKQSNLHKAYIKYKNKKNTKKSLLSGFLSAMPKMILRTTKLEGENVTIKMISSLFK